MFHKKPKFLSKQGRLNSEEFFGDKNILMQNNDSKIDEVKEELDDIKDELSNGNRKDAIKQFDKAISPESERGKKIESFLGEDEIEKIKKETEKLLKLEGNLEVAQQENSQYIGRNSDGLAQTISNMAENEVSIKPIDTSGNINDISQELNENLQAELENKANLKNNSVTTVPQNNR